MRNNSEQWHAESPPRQVRSPEKRGPPVVPTPTHSDENAVKTSHESFQAWAHRLAGAALAAALMTSSPLLAHPPLFASALPLVAPLAGLLLVLVALFAWHVFRRRPAAREASRVAGFDSAELVELLDLSSDWQWKTDAQHRYVHITAGLQEHSRIDPLEFLGRTPWELDSGEALAHRDACQASLAQQAPLNLTLCRHDNTGRRRYLELVGRPLYHDGSFAGYHGIGRDITHRVESDQSLRENQVRYRELIESVNEIIFRTDESGRLTFLNRGWETITGYTLKESLDTALVDHFHPDDRTAAWHQISLVFRQEIPAWSAQLRLLTQNGEIRWVEATAHRVDRGNEDGTAPRGLAGTLFDISARKIAEMTLRNINRELEARVRARTAELEASNRELEAFSYSVSHDLRAPLRAIDGFARILEEELGDGLEPDAREHIGRIRKAGMRMSHLIDDLIKLAQLARHSLQRETFDLSELAIQIIDELRRNEPDRRVEVEITRDLLVTADRGLMQLALQNLLGNAWKFSSRNAVAHISLTAKRDLGQRVFCITDDGVGFDMTFASNLFRAFHRLHRSTDFPGSGIGLATTYRIIERHGGQIWAKSKPGEGASFYFTLGR
uniref:histidine kinase n=2 Tax=Aromatoleum anaerobium TaxID=182180 RepID=A0ABX1PNM2_9RHOO